MRQVYNLELYIEHHVVTEVSILSPGNWNAISVTGLAQICLCVFLEYALCSSLSEDLSIFTDDELSIQYHFSLALRSSFNV